MKKSSEDLLNKCKAIAIIITALAGLILGVLNWFKEVKDPVAKSGYAELAHQVEGMSKDVQHLAGTVKLHQEQIMALQNWLLYERDKRGAAPGPVETKIKVLSKTQRPIAMPAPRTPPKWEKLQRAE